MRGLKAPHFLKRKLEHPSFFFYFKGQIGKTNRFLFRLIYIEGHTSSNPTERSHGNEIM